MKHNPLKLWGLAALVMAGIHGVTDAAAPPPVVPDLTKGAKNEGFQQWNMGPTGIRGGAFCQGFDTSASRQILVGEVAKGSPADGLLAAGDVILGVNGKLFDHDARRSLGEAITMAEETANMGQLKLVRWRAGTQQEVTIPLRVMGSYSPTSPYNCDKAKAIVAEGCKAIMKRGFPGDGLNGAVDGDWQPSIENSLNALALLASGNPDYADAVKAQARKIGPPDLKLKLQNGMFTWPWSYANLFLTEYYLATKDEAVLPAIREFTVKMSVGQGATGTWGHGFKVEGNNGTLGGYGAINQSGLICWMSMILGRQCGVNDPVVLAAIERSRVFFGFYVGKGSVPYGDHPPYTLLHDDNGKSSSAAMSFDLLDDKPAARFFSRMATAAYEEKENGHTGNYFSFLWGALGANRSGPEAAAAYMKELRWYYDLARRWDGSFFTNARDNYNYDMTGLFVLHYAMPLQKLAITGRGIHPDNRLTGKELREVVGWGRTYRYGHENDCDNGLGIEALLKNLTCYSPTVRFRAARALAQKPDDVVPQLIGMLKTGDLPTKYGVCAALQSLGKRSAAATDELIVQLSAKDSWLRVQAAQALACIGEPARNAVPQLLQMVVRENPADPRRIEAKYIGYALFRDGFIDQMPIANGLVAGSLDGVDRKLLYPAVRTLLSLDDGMGTSGISSVFKTLNNDDFKALTPSLVKVAGETAPSGEMFAQGVRLYAIQYFARNKVPEGLPAIMEYLRTQNGWGNQIVNVLKELAKYGAVAKPLLPELKQLRDGWKLMEKDQKGETRTSTATAVIQAIEDAK